MQIGYAMNGDNMPGKAEVVLQHVRVGEKTGDEFLRHVGIPLELALALLQDVRRVVRLRLSRQPCSSGTRKGREK